ncbi:glycosyltransferase involved in cell wall biosynthesis [Lachnospiraceae bacterium PF1-22]|uniref:glycosyltransferase n=1 Tax=Ohessyouella blattaphilus TaxID=2949333 RepID=UPI003E1A072A
MRILYVINTLNGGGAERIFIDTIKLLDPKKFSVDVLVVDDYGQFRDELKKVLPYKRIIRHVKNPKIVRWWFGGWSWIMTKILKYLPANILHNWYVKEEYDIEIAYLEGISTKIVSGCKNEKTVTYAWVHTDVIENPWATVQYRTAIEEQNAYKNINKIIAVSNSVKVAFERKFQSNAEVLYNVLDDKQILEIASKRLRKLKRDSRVAIVSVGSLYYTKGYMRLVKVVHRLLQQGFEVQLHIIGEGIDRQEIENYIKRNDLEKDIFMYGFIQEPYDLMSQADIYVCSSYAEGFSTTITEALLLGVPVVTTECAGMQELLGDSEYGIITDNSDDGLYLGLKRMIKNTSLRNNYKAKAIARGRKFSSKNTLRDLEQMLLGK